MPLEKVDSLSEVLLLRTASKACYALGLWIIFSSACFAMLRLSGLQLVPQSLLPAFGLVVYVTFFLAFMFGFYMSRIGRAYELPLLRRGLILLAPSLIVLSIVFSPVATGSSLAFLQGMPPPLSDLVAIAILLSGGLICVSAFAFALGMLSMVRKTRLGELRESRSMRTAFITLIVSWSLVFVVFLFGIFHRPRGSQSKQRTIP